MTTPQSPRKRTYQPHQAHGLYTLKKTLKKVGKDHHWMTNLGGIVNLTSCKHNGTCWLSDGTIPYAQTTSCQT